MCSKTMCGTKEYLAPEVLEDRQEGYKNVADSWSIGMIIFQMYVLYSEVLS